MLYNILKIYSYLFRETLAWLVLLGISMSHTHKGVRMMMIVKDRFISGKGAVLPHGEGAFLLN
jgi:hypothetical protein